MPFRLADFYNETRGARKLIVIELGYLGDSIHLVPTLCEIKRNYPQAELHVASAPVGSEFLQLVPVVDRTWPLARTPGGTPWRHQWHWLRDVRREKFDVALNFNGTDRTVILTFLTGAPWQVAFEGGRRHFWNRWLIPYWIPRRDRTIHLAEQRRQVLGACGLTVGAIEYPLQIPAAAQRWAEEHAPPQAVHLSVNAGHDLKEWPVENWVALANSLLKENPRTRLVATATRSPREQARLRQFGQGVHSDRLQVFAEGLSVAQFAALLARCRLHVGADSGALHLATVLGLKTVSLFREYEGIGEWLPRGKEHRYLIAPCGCVNQRVQPCAAQARPVCLAAIPFQKVLSLIQELLRAE
jgi:ADP-heptose:LPS heptosyltransferase